MKKRFLPLAGAFGVAILAASFNFGGERASATVPGTNTLIDPAYNSSTTASNSSGQNGMVSANGKFVLFSSTSTNVTSGDTNGDIDIFVRNVSSGTTTRVSVSTSGVQADGNSSLGAISETGRYVIFTSNSSNLIDSTTTPTTTSQLYLHDTTAGTTILLSKNTSGTASTGDSYAAGTGGVSSDGRFVVFVSTATDLGPSVSNGGYNYYLLDRNTGTFTILNTKYDGTIPKNLATLSASMSCDGSFITFENSAPLTTQASSHFDIYLADIRNGNSLTNLTASTNGAAFAPTISCNGNYITLGSDGSNLDSTVSLTQNGNCWVYAYDRINSKFSLAEQSSSGTPGTGYACWSFYAETEAVSNTGVVAFTSHSTNLTSDGISGEQVYLHNLETGTTELLSRNSGDTQGNNDSRHISISANGAIASYDSRATNLISYTDTNNNADVFTSLTGY